MGAALAMVALAARTGPTANDVAPPRFGPAPVSSAVGTTTLVALGLIGTGMLLLALVLAFRARKPRARHAPRKSFEAGRALGLAASVTSEKDALDALGRAPVAHVQRAAVVPGALRVTVARKRSEACDLVAGYLSGLMERAWASDVDVRHTGCVGNKKAGTCEYDVIRVFGRAEGSSTRGSGAAARRSPQARRGPA